jgi:hypothetical protein
LNVRLPAPKAEQPNIAETAVRIRWSSSQCLSHAEAIAATGETDCASNCASYRMPQIGTSTTDASMLHVCFLYRVVVHLICVEGAVFLIG